MMTDLGCFVITEGHVSCSAVIITNYSIQLFFSGFCEFAFFFATQQRWPTSEVTPLRIQGCANFMHHHAFAADGH